jgi:Protein of unknown function (DUF2829)
MVGPVDPAVKACPPSEWTRLMSRRMEETFDFGEVLKRSKEGALLTRRGWNGNGQFIYLVDGSRFTVNRAPLLGIYDEGTEITYRPHIDIRTVDGSCVPWIASQTDLLAEDWVVTEA